MEHNKVLKKMGKVQKAFLYIVSGKELGVNRDYVFKNYHGMPHMVCAADSEYWRRFT